MLKTMEIERRFTFVPPDKARAKQHAAVGEACKTMAHYLNGELPPSREASLALTHLEQVRMYANMAIATNVEPAEGGA